MYFSNAIIFLLWYINFRIQWVVSQLPPAQRCVLPGTCVSPPTPSVDVRIVLPNNPPGPTIPSCPPGLVPCTGTVAPQCGVQYVSNPSTGDGVTTPGAFPWQVYMLNQSGFTGSGVLIDANYVLTAAHKVDLNVNSPSNIVVMLGVYNPQSTTNALSFRAASISIPPTYTRSSLRDDVALIRLNNPVPLATRPDINHICLPPQGTSFINRTCLVSGWGQSQFTIYDSPTTPQKQVNVPIVSYDVCRRGFLQTLSPTVVDQYLTPERNLCAGGQANRDACTNDGGGPLMCLDSAGRYTVAGLVLWGKGCGNEGLFGVYANVANYRTWIDSVVLGNPSVVPTAILPPIQPLTQPTLFLPPQFSTGATPAVGPIPRTGG